LSSFHRQPSQPFRALLLALLVQGLTGGSALGQPAHGAPSAALPPELQEVLDKMQPQWSVSMSARAASGFKDNLALSHANPERSGFVRGGLDLLVLHPPRFPDGRIDYSAYVTAEGTRFFSGETVDHEGIAQALAEWDYRLDKVFRFTATASGFYLDQVLDQSDTDVQRVVVQSKRTIVMAGPTMRWSPQSWWWIEAHGEARREAYRDGFNNANVSDGSLQIGWKPGKRFEAKITGDETRRRFRSREEYSAGGRPLAGTLLRIAERELEARVDATWDAAGCWKTTSRVSRLDYGDNGSSYFNYGQRRARQRIEWKADPWLVRIEGSAKRLDFEVMTVGVGISPPLRVQEKFAAELRIERQWSKRWSVFAEYSWERSRCNDPIASYRMNEGLLGAVWTWDK